MQLLRDNLTVSVCAHMAQMFYSLCHLSVMLPLMSVLWLQYSSDFVSLKLCPPNENLAIKHLGLAYIDLQVIVVAPCDHLLITQMLSLDTNGWKFVLDLCGDIHPTHIQ